MKEIEINYGINKKIVVTKDFLTILIGVGIIIIDTLLAGLIQLFNVDFDTSQIVKVNFWGAYLIKLLISYIALFGAYVIKKTINKTNKKFIVQRARIRDVKEFVVSNKKIGVFKDWLKNVYNYRKRVESYRSILMLKYEKLVLQELEEPLKENFKNKGKYNKAVKKYYKLKEKFIKNDKKRIFLEEQLNICDIHLEIIECYKLKNFEKMKELQSSIEKKDQMAKHKLKIVSISYNKLFNVELTNSKTNDEVECNEANILIKKIIPSIFMGILFCAVFTSIIVYGGSITIEIILVIFLNLLLMAWYIFNGVKFADTFVLEIMFTADFNRLCICEEFLEYCNLFQTEKNDKE